MRRAYAALLCVVWLLGLEVLPNLHLARHERPHTHAADGTVIVVTFDRAAEPHRHADGTVHAHSAIGERERATRRARPGVLAWERAPDDHAATGLAHRAAALHAAAPVVVAIPRIDLVAHVARLPRTGRDTVALVATRDARGPPSA